jgi:hypothetical protein
MAKKEVNADFKYYLSSFTLTNAGSFILPGGL